MTPTPPINRHAFDKAMQAQDNMHRCSAFTRLQPKMFRGHIDIRKWNGCRATRKEDRRARYWARQFAKWINKSIT